MTMTENYAQLLATRGVSLDRLGLRAVALRRDDALAAIKALRESSVPILGGDVYFEHGENVESAYANWYVDKQDTESRTDFAARSCSKAENYVASFPKRTDKQPLFVLVPFSG
jgi:lipoprotein NlpI